MDIKAVIFILYIIVINLIGFYLMWNDKQRAKKGKWRVKESTFFIISAIGGGVGCLMGMYSFRHKTKHKSFIFGIPVCMITGIAALVAVGILLIF